MQIVGMWGQRAMHILSDGYSSEVDTVDEATWYQLLDEFDDANIYQTWAYGEVRDGRANISHLVLKKGGEVVAIAQSRMARIKFAGIGIAYVMRGPLWTRHGTFPDPETFRQVVRALRNEYVCKRGLLLRIYPNLFEEDSPHCLSVLGEEGFCRPRSNRQTMTIVMDLKRSIEELRHGLQPHWQRELKVAEKQKMELTEGDQDGLIGKFIEIYKEMVARKQFREPNDINEFRIIQQRLPEKFKMRVMLCGHGKAVSAGAICSAIGGTALYLFGATSNVGMKSRGSYLLQWKLIEWLKQRQVRYYDLNGINPETNPGTYKFKSDLAGQGKKEIHFAGQFDSCESKVESVCIGVAEKLRAALSRR